MRGTGECNERRRATQLLMRTHFAGNLIAALPAPLPQQPKARFTLRDLAQFSAASLSRRLKARFASQKSPRISLKNNKKLCLMSYIRLRVERRYHLVMQFASTYAAAH
jgi:hypothetical protein